MADVAGATAPRTQPVWALNNVSDDEVRRAVENAAGLFTELAAADALAAEAEAA